MSSFLFLISLRGYFMPHRATSDSWGLEMHLSSAFPNCIGFAQYHRENLCNVLLWMFFYASVYQTSATVRMCSHCLVITSSYFNKRFIFGLEIKQGDTVVMQAAKCSSCFYTALLNSLVMTQPHMFIHKGYTASLCTDYLCFVKLAEKI